MCTSDSFQVPNVSSIHNESCLTTPVPGKDGPGTTRPGKWLGLP